MVIQIQIGLIFDAVSLILNRDIQFLIAAFEFQIGIVVFDFRFDNLKTVAACISDDFSASEGMEMRLPGNSASYSNSPLP